MSDYYFVSVISFCQYMFSISMSFFKIILINTYRFLCMFMYTLFEYYRWNRLIYCSSDLCFLFSLMIRSNGPNSKKKILINIEMMNVNLISIGIMITFFFCRALLAFGWIYLMHAFTQPVVDRRRQTIRALMMMMINCQQYINGRQNRNRARERLLHSIGKRVLRVGRRSIFNDDKK
jgi:hypothetical protein